MTNEPTIKSLSRSEIDAYNDVVASIERLETASAALMDRLRMNVPHGWRDMRMITTRLMTLSRQLSMTMPMEKRRQILRHASHIRIKLVYGPSASADPEMHLIMTHDFAIMLKACGDVCKVCMGTSGQCKQCELGKALDRTSFVSRDGQAWWEVFNSTSD